MLLIIKTPFSTRSTENLGEARRRKRAETPLLVWDGRRLHSVGLAWLQVSVSVSVSNPIKFVCSLAKAVLSVVVTRCDGLRAAMRVVFRVRVRQPPQS